MSFTARFSLARLNLYCYGLAGHRLHEKAGEPWADWCLCGRPVWPSSPLFLDLGADWLKLGAHREPTTFQPKATELTTTTFAGSQQSQWEMSGDRMLFSTQCCNNYSPAVRSGLEDDKVIKAPEFFFFFWNYSFSVVVWVSRKARNTLAHLAKRELITVQEHKAQEQATRFVLILEHWKILKKNMVNCSQKKPVCPQWPSQICFIPHNTLQHGLKLGRQIMWLTFDF